MEAKTITLRAATAADAAAIAQVHVDSWRMAYRGLLPEGEIRPISFSKPGPGKVDVADDGERIIGFSSYGPTRDDDGSAEIYALYVHPERWRRGAGRLLCERAVRAAIERGHEAITLWVAKGNERACRFYERLGFTLDDAQRRNERLLAAPFTEMRYRKSIGL